ncbi:MAG: sugar phosphorylase [Woeseiaceae bacterium]
MAKRSQSNASSWANHLSSLYAKDVVDVVVGRIDALLARYRQFVDQSDKQALSEKDVLLITYGDTITENRTPPLQTLHRFYREYLSGVFDLIHILPFHPYSSDDGFAVIDFYRVREDLGDWGDINKLSRDCRIMSDAVINHMSCQSDWFRGFLAGDPDYADFFVECDPAEDLSEVTRPRTSPLLTQFADGKGNKRHMWTTFSADQVDLNYRNPEVLLAVLEVLFYLVKQGARLLRLDAVTYLWKQPGTDSANLPETHAIIKIIRGAVDELRPDVVVVTETNVPHHQNVAYFGDGHDEAHMVYNFALPPLIAHSLITGDSRQLTDWARQISLPGDEACFLNFSASHDGVGVRPVEQILNASELQRLGDAAEAAGGMVSFRTMCDGEKHPYELNCTFLDLISRQGDPRETLVSRFVASQAIVLSMPGVPAIYVQSLLGTRNDLAGVKRTGSARSINRSRHRYADVKKLLDDGNSLAAAIFAGLAAMTAVRRTEAAFDPYGEFEVLDLGRAVFAIKRQSARSSSCIVCIVNLTDRQVDLEIDAGLVGTDVLADEEVVAGVKTMAPYAVRWIRCANDT